MKRSFCLSATVLFCLGSLAQADIPPYKKVPYFPPVKLLLSDSSTWYQKDDLPKKTPVLMMYFNPNCDHCQHETEDIVKNIDKFKDIHIVMATGMHFDSMRVFKERYRLGNFKNIVVGYDPGFFLMTFYQVHSLPFLALYNRWKELISAFEGGLPVDKILQAFDQ